MDLNAIYLRCRFWTIDFLKGSPIGKPYKEVKYIQEHSFQKGQHIREKALHHMLEFAAANSPFYHSLGTNLSDYPVMNKAKIMDNYEKIRVEEHLIPGQKGKVHIQPTSGSTGTTLKIAQDTNKRLRRIAELKYFGKIVGFKTHDKLIHLRTWSTWIKKTAQQIKTENIIPFDISTLDDARLKELCELAISSKAICLRGYASSLGQIAQYALKNGYQFPHLKIAISGSESLLDGTRKLFKRVMKCEIISQYADEECGILAQERIPTKQTDNPMYLNWASYFFEFLKMDSDEPAEFGELARIVITDLHNYAFPLIRYDCGDVAVIGKPDEYSNGYPIIEKLYGRRADITYSTSGAPIYLVTYGAIMEHFIENYHGILQWQFVQNGEKDYTLKVVLAKDHNVVLSDVVSQIKENIGNDATVNVEQLDDIPVLASRKRKAVVNNWKK
ncbi:MAG: hypothetical protein Q4D14_04425 [Bacteroidales bacterium]|nr:hypothetical protein [Bacteroidales bacterium]